MTTISRLVGLCAAALLTSVSGATAVINGNYKSSKNLRTLNLEQMVQDFKPFVTIRKKSAHRRFVLATVAGRVRPALPNEVWRKIDSYAIPRLGISQEDFEDALKILQRELFLALGEWWFAAPENPALEIIRKLKLKFAPHAMDVILGDFTFRTEG